MIHDENMKFLHNSRVTHENDGPLKPHQAFTDEDEKLKGSALYVQSVRALLAKKMTYTLKNMSIVLLKFFTVWPQWISSRLKIPWTILNFQ